MNYKRIFSIGLAVVIAGTLAVAMPFAVHASEGAACAEEGCDGTYAGGICTKSSSHYEACVLTTTKYDLDGDGAKDEVYEIASLGNFSWFTKKVNDGDHDINAVLTADIDVKGEWMPIGAYASVAGQYSGIFDGMEHTVSYATASLPNMGRCTGLFGTLSGVAKNVKVANFNFGILEIDNYGAIAGENRGTVINCTNLTVEGHSLYSARTAVGGLVGVNEGTIKDSVSYATVSGTNYVGGIAGSNDGGRIENCINYGSVYGSSKNIGGIAGENRGVIVNCVNNRDVSGNSGAKYIGGVTGSNYGDITWCTNNGIVSGIEDRVAGIAGHSDDGKISFSTNYGAVKGYGDYVGGIVGYNATVVYGCMNYGTIEGNSDGMHGGIVGFNKEVVEQCGNVGLLSVVNGGGVVGYNIGTVSGCFSYGTAKNGYTVFYWNSSVVENTYYRNDTAKYYSSSDTFEITKVGDESFSSGEIAFLLNSSITDGDNVWYQSIDGSAEKSAYPVIDKNAGAVYKKCDGTSYVYSNSSEGTTHGYTGECDTVCDACGYTREVSVEHIKGEEANCGRGPICLTCHSQYGEKSGTHNVDEKKGVCYNCDHAFALRYVIIDTTEAIYTDNANEAFDAIIGGANRKTYGGHITLYRDVTYEGNYENQVNGNKSTIVMNGFTLTINGYGMDYWGTKLIIDATRGGTINCIKGNPFTWKAAEIKIIGDVDLQKNGQTITLSFSGMNTQTPTLDLTEYTGEGFKITQSYTAGLTVLIPSWYSFINDSTGEVMTNADIVNGAVARVVYSHNHSWTYQLDGNRITATCNGEGCRNTDGGYVTLNAPLGLVYTGQPIEAELINNLLTDDEVSVIYTSESALIDGKPVTAGTYTASITVGGITVSVDYTVAECPHNSYTNGECDSCDFVCTHTSLEGGACAECHEEVAHECTDGNRDERCDMCGGVYSNDTEDGSQTNPDATNPDTTEPDTTEPDAGDGAEDGTGDGTQSGTGPDTGDGDEGGTNSGAGDGAQNDPNPRDDGDGLSGGAVAGIVTGSSATVGVGCFSLIWFVIKKKKWSDLFGVFK